MKVVKIACKILIAVVALLLVAVLALPFWFGPVVKTVANAAVPGIVKTDFRIGHLSLNPYTARFELGDLQLANPAGYSEKQAVTVGDVVFDAETLSLMTDVIHIEEIKVKDLFVSVVSGGENKVLNFKQIQYNVAGGKEKYEAAQAEKEKKAASAQDKPAAKDKPKATEKQGAEKPAKKVIIDRLEVSGLLVQLSVLPIRIPSIVLTDIGRKSGGATLEEVWNQILESVLKAAGVAGDQLKALGALTGETTRKAGEAVSKATAQATAAVSSASKQLTETTAKATSAVSSTVGAATGAASNAAGAATDAVNDGVKAVGDGAKKAMDSLKKLW